MSEEGVTCLFVCLRIEDVYLSVTTWLCRKKHPQGPPDGDKIKVTADHGGSYQHPGG